MKVLVIRLPSILVTVVALLAVARAETSQRPHAVGLPLAAYEDAARRDWNGTQDRPLKTAVWYPAPAGTREADMYDNREFQPTALTGRITGAPDVGGMRGRTLYVFACKH